MRITFVVDRFDTQLPKEVLTGARPMNEHELHLVQRDHDQLWDYLRTLVNTDVAYLLDHPETPLLYDAHARGLVRYQEEPEGEEDWLDVPHILKQGWGDCLPASTLVLRDDYTFVPILGLSPGDRIMGDGEFVDVLDGAVTGEKPILAFDLSNGCRLRCSPDHRLFLQDGEEVRASEVRVGMALRCPSKPFPTLPTHQSFEGMSDDDYAWLLGTYIADGWHDLRGNRFAISGDEENPKRGKLEQKDRVEAIAKAMGINTTRRKKWVDVFSAELTRRMMACGGVAPKKRLSSLAFTESQVRSVIEGLKTDASIASTGGTVTHGTVSPILALQLRVLYRMLGQNSSISTTVRAVSEEPTEICADIMTSSGSFYLPETDLVVHNCEEIAAWRVAELRVKLGMSGAEPYFIWSPRPEGGNLYHILVKYPNGLIEDPCRKTGMR